MRPLTDTCPKPLLQVQGMPLMQWHLQALAAQGFDDVVVNTAWLGEQIEERFGNGLHYSHEGRDFGGALETAGGIARALPCLEDVFWVVAGDVFAPDFGFSRAHYAGFAAGTMLAHLWLVPNPAHNPLGDFGLDQVSGLAQNLAKNAPQPRYTYSTIGLYRKTLFQAPYCAIAPGNPHGEKAPLAPVLRAAMDAGRVSASLYTGPWTDVGTPERLRLLNASAPYFRNPL